MSKQTRNPPAKTIKCEAFWSRLDIEGGGMFRNAPKASIKANIKAGIKAGTGVR
jgi:hypothetical protein